MAKETPFTALKRDRPIHSAVVVRGGIFFFRLQEDDYGFYVETCNKKRKIVSPDVSMYSGSVRTALELYRNIEHNVSWQVEWDRAQGRAYLSDFPDFVEALKQCDNVISSSFEKIQIVDKEEAELVLKGKEKSGGLEWSVGFSCNNKEYYRFKMVSASLILVKNKLFKTVPTFNYRYINLFSTDLALSETDRFLSLFKSFFPHGTIEYFGYRVIQGSRIIPAPALVMEEVDEEGALYASVLVSAGEADIDMLNNYDLTSVVSVDSNEKSIHIRPLASIDISASIVKIEKLLKKYQNKKSDNFSFTLIDNLFVIQRDLALTFLESELHHLISDFVLIGKEKLGKFNIKTVKPDLGLHLSSGIDFLEGSAEITIDDDIFTYQEFLKRFDKNNYIILSDGTRAIVEHGYIKRIKRLLKIDDDGKVRVSFFDLPLVSDLIDAKTTGGEGFIQSRSILEGFNTLYEKKPELPKLNKPLRDYQEKGFAWLKYLHDSNLGGCLADDMGLGKTVQAIALLATMYPVEKKSSLVVMPRSLLFNWKREIEKFTSAISAVVYHGPERDLTKALGHNVILTTYAMVRNDISLFKDIEFYAVILDESQKIKNIDSRISKAVMLLNGKWRLALSGTPVENNLGELYSLFRFLNPSMFGSVGDFKNNYYNPIVKGGEEELITELKKKIYPFILRRLKTEVLKELPEKTEQIIYVDMSTEQKILYESRRDFFYTAIKNQIDTEGFSKSRFFLFQALNELRQIAGIPEAKSDGRVASPKVEVLLEYLDEVIENGHKVIVFANYLEALNLVGDQLSKRNIRFLTMTGKTRRRDSLVDSFQTDKDSKVFLMTLKTGGVGLNLTAADYVFIFDPWWNAAAENQAVDRVHRIGQENSVFSYKLITRDTIEEKILLLQQKKTDLVNMLIESDGEGKKILDEEDIDFIFSRSSF